VRSYSLTASFGRSRSGAPLVRRLFRAEDANSPWSFSEPRRAFTEPCRPLTLPWSPARTPESVSFVPPDALVRRPAPLRDGILETFDPRVLGLRIALPVKA